MNKGFSLVELIVVIAIMAILVGVAVPTYTAYIEKAEAGVEVDVVGQMVYAAKLANIEYSTTSTIEYNDTSDTVTLTFTGEKASAAADQVRAILVEADGIGGTGGSVTYTASSMSVEQFNEVAGGMKS